MLRRTLLHFCWLAACAHAAAQPLSDTEQRIAAAARQRSAAALELLERSVRSNSGTLRTEGVRQAGTLYRAELDTMGFATRRFEMPPAMKRAGHLIATREGRHGQRLLLMGHIDTVFEKDSAVAAGGRRGDHVRGQDVADMKGGNGLNAFREQLIEERVGSPIPEACADHGLGVSGCGIHTEDEELDVASIERAAIRAAILICRLTRP